MMMAVSKFVAVYNRLMLGHRFARYNKGIVFGIAAVISAISLYYGNDAVSTIADAFGVVGGIATPNADKPPAPPSIGTTTGTTATAT